jgi:hypothetical protein
VLALSMGQDVAPALFHKCNYAKDEDSPLMRARCHSRARTFAFARLLSATTKEVGMTCVRAWLIALAVLAFAPTRVLAHDWYPLSCCSDKDCHALQEENGETVIETEQGWRLWDGRIIARNKSRLSPDRQFHLCETSLKSIICFFAPPGNF